MLSLGPVDTGGGGYSLGNDADKLSSESSGTAGLSSPFTFNGGGGGTPGGAVPAWVIVAGIAAVALVLLKGRK